MKAEGLKAAIARFKRTKNKKHRDEVSLLPESTFDAVLDLRLIELKRQVGELKNTVYGLCFFVLGAAIVQVTLGFL